MKKTFSKYFSKDFLYNKAKSVKKEDMIKVLEHIKEIYTKLDIAATTREIKDYVKLSIMLIKDYKSGKYRDVSWFTIAMLVFTLLYFLNPVDLIPDLIPIIGYSDDLSLIIICLKSVKDELDRYKIWKEAEIRKEENIIDVQILEEDVK